MTKQIPLNNIVSFDFNHNSIVCSRHHFWLEATTCSSWTTQCSNEKSV